MSYDDVIVYIGEFGRYQCAVYLLLFLGGFPYAFHSMAGVFIEAAPDFRCLLPFENPDNVTFELSSNITSVVFPWDETTKSWSRCLRYDINRTDDQTSNVTVKCDSFVYDKTIYELTTVTEFDQVCDKEWLKAMPPAMFMASVMIGAPVFGGLADRYGRKPIMCLAAIVNLVAGLITAYSPEPISFIVCRVLLGMSTYAMYVTGFVAAVEMAYPKRRMLIGILMHLFFSFGYLLTTAFAYYIRNWRILQVAITVPSLGYIAYWWLIPESARWLLSSGRKQEAKDVILKAASTNRVEVSEETLDRMLRGEGNQQPETEEGLSIVDLFKYPNLARKSLLLFFNWFANNTTYYGLSWNTSHLGGNDYVNFAVAGLVEIPGTILVYFTLDRWGRRIVLCGSLILSGISLLLITIVPDDMQWVVVVLAMIGKMSVTSSFIAVTIFSAEQYPTVIRNVGVSACSTFASVGGIVAPYILLSSSIWTPLPYVVFGSCSLLAGISALLLPETLNVNLPETIQDGEEFGKKKQTVKKKKISTEHISMQATVSKA